MGAEHSSFDHGDVHDDLGCDDGVCEDYSHHQDFLASRESLDFNPGQDPSMPHDSHQDPFHPDVHEDTTDTTHQPILATAPALSTTHQPIAGGLFSYEHHPDCDTAYPTEGHPLNVPENFVCNEAETHRVWDDVRQCLQDEQAGGVGFVERHYDCWADHFTDNGGGDAFGPSNDFFGAIPSF